MGYDIERTVLLENMREVKGQIESTYSHVDLEKSKDSFPLRFNSLLLKKCGLPYEIDTSKKMVRMFANGIQFTKYPETEEVLEALYMNHEMGVISNWNLDRELDDVLRQKDIYRFFDYTLASKDVGYEKPDPNIFKIALNGMRTNASDVYYIGDSYVEDVIGAMETGMNPIFVNRRMEPNPRDVPTVEDLRGIIDIIEENSK